MKGSSPDKPCLSPIAAGKKNPWEGRYGRRNETAKLLAKITGT